MSDNKNRTVASRHAFRNVEVLVQMDLYLIFSKKGQIVTNESNQDKLLELLISEGIEDIESSEDNLTLILQMLIIFIM